jgi:hypothetical protein
MYLVRPQNSGEEFPLREMRSRFCRQYMQAQTIMLDLEDEFRRINELASLEMSQPQKWTFED